MFHIFILIYSSFTGILRTIRRAPSWLDSSTGRALHRHRRGHGFESRSSQAFFSQLSKLCVDNCHGLSHIYSFIRSSISYIHFHKRRLHRKDKRKSQGLNITQSKIIFHSSLPSTQNQLTPRDFASHIRSYF